MRRFFRWLREKFGYDPEPYGEDGQDSDMSGGFNDQAWIM